MKSWKDNVRKAVPYIPGEQPNIPGMVKLNTNENPYPPSPKIQEMLSKMQADDLRLYPDPEAGRLVQAIAKVYSVDVSRVFVGVGSDDVLAMAFMTFFNSDKPVFFPDITYSFYPVWADLFRIPYETKPLDEKFHMTAADYYGENGGIIFPNPNAPTSLLESLDFVEDIIKHNQDSVVIVDEAYIDFGGESASKLVSKYDNLLVVRTFSKSRSMAGLRIGFAIGQPEMIRALNDVKYSFNSYTLNRPSIDLGAEALGDGVYFDTCIQKIINTRAWSKTELGKLGFRFPEPSGNFIFATHMEYPAKELFEELREANIFVRYFNLPRIDNYLRITIGTDTQMKGLIEFLDRFMRKNK